MNKNFLALYLSAFPTFLGLRLEIEIFQSHNRIVPSQRNSELQCE